MRHYSEKHSQQVKSRTQGLSSITLGSSTKTRKRLQPSTIQLINQLNTTGCPQKPEQKRDTLALKSSYSMSRTPLRSARQNRHGPSVIRQSFWRADRCSTPRFSSTNSYIKQYNLLRPPKRRRRKPLDLGGYDRKVSSLRPLQARTNLGSR